MGVPAPARAGLSCKSAEPQASPRWRASISNDRLVPADAAFPRQPSLLALHQRRQPGDIGRDAPRFIGQDFGLYRVGFVRPAVDVASA